MDIEAIVKKYSTCAPECSYDFDRYSAEVMLREALTELAAGYEQKIAGLESEAILSRALSERIRQLDARLGGYLTVGGGHIVHGTAEALARVQAYILLDSKHPIEARDTNRYFAKQLQAAEQRIRHLESERVPEAILEIGRRMIADARDNDHGTAHPMFRVEKRRIVTGIDLDYTDSIAWIDEDGEILDPEEAATFESAYDETGEVPDGYTRTGFAEEWEHVDTYLTQQAAEARINGGKDGRVNVESAYRNSEMRVVREFLMSLAAAPQQQQKKKEGK